MLTNNWFTLMAIFALGKPFYILTVDVTRQKEKDGSSVSDLKLPVLMLKKKCVPGGSQPLLKTNSNLNMTHS